MRMTIPKEIHDLAVMVFPYMEKDSNGFLVLREDAPEEIKAAKKKHSDWMQAYQAC